MITSIVGVSVDVSVRVCACEVCECGGFVALADTQPNTNNDSS